MWKEPNLERGAESEDTGLGWGDGRVKSKKFIIVLELSSSVASLSVQSLFFSLPVSCMKFKIYSPALPLFSLPHLFPLFHVDFLLCLVAKSQSKSPTITFQFVKNCAKGHPIPSQLRKQKSFAKLLFIFSAQFISGKLFCFLSTELGSRPLLGRRLWAQS